MNKETFEKIIRETLIVGYQTIKDEDKYVSELIEKYYPTEKSHVYNYKDHYLLPITSTHKKYDVRFYNKLDYMKLKDIDDESILYSGMIDFIDDKNEELFGLLVIDDVMQTDWDCNNHFYYYDYEEECNLKEVESAYNSFHTMTNKEYCVIKKINKI